jgi:hypothetical protein
VNAEEGQSSGSLTAISKEDKKMGAGVGKMFGIDKMFGGLLDSIGLGALKPIVSTAFDFATGNVMGVLQDLSQLMKSFGNGDFTNNVANNPALPNNFSQDNPVENENYNNADNNENTRTCSSRDNNRELSSDRIGKLFKLLGELFSSKDPSEIKEKMGELFKLLSETANNRQEVSNRRTNLQFFSGSLTTSV